MLEILTSMGEIAAGRRQLEAWGASLYPSSLRRLLFRVRRKIGLPATLIWPEWTKSWDVARTVALVRERVARDEPILDMGCFNSEVLWSLARLGYRNLAGCDLDQRCLAGPFAGTIQYSVQDLTRTSFADASFRAISCISVMEHGVDEARFLAEARRLLAPGGYLVISTDYWPKSIPTSEVQAFGLPWRIFARPDIEAFLSSCERLGFHSLGPLNWREPSPVVSWQARRYSFAWMALVKRGA
jgi:SAM-dependent methyltransferase